MSFWKEACLNLRHAVPKSGNSIGRAQSKRFLTSSYSTQTPRVIASSRLPINARRDFLNQQSWMARRSFSVTACAQHGHITPPKPGEE